MIRSDFGSALVSGAQKSGALELVAKVNSPNIAKGLFGGFDNSALPVYYKSYSSNQFAKKIPMIENDESEDESLIEFKDLSFQKIC